ncbi:uncharacterized protein N0V89_006825 [Didymosphaeria variabile]|uniref:MYND-type domain-containing protein n=1 Tax=Didymosphaeria variabile TaxID=1932322 RepID=A0A9W8XIH4_9PLEO|nr:uncharacterized protein N0V89_006825 [Didymosphaeria variabile]KAJ4351482.1 hypothetical protein N0V89_006825 [Didymosphaeria variabile]
MNETEINSCVNCGAAASKFCSSCRVSKYCDRTCQTKNWPTHKISCGKSGIDLVVHRAGQLLQDLYLAMREAAYDTTIASVKEEGETLIIQDAPIDAGKLARFPNELMRSDVQKKMALTAFTCEDPLVLCHDIFVQMLEGTGLQVDELRVATKPTAKKVRIISPCGSWETTDYNHVIIRVKSTDGRAWIVDVTGPQYGIFKSCCPESVYMKKYVLELKKVYEFGTHKANYEMRNYMFMHISWGAMEKIEATISAWKSDTGRTLATLLREPDIIFQKNARNLMSDSKRAVDRFVADVVAVEEPDTKAKADSVPKEDSKKTDDAMARLKKDHAAQSPIPEIERLLKSASVQDAGYAQAACNDED